VDINEKRLEIGMAAPIEVLQAKAGVAPRITDLVTARRLIADSEDILKNLLSMRDGEILSPARIIPINRPSDFEFVWTEEDSLRLALTLRTENVQQQLAIENAVIGRRQARTNLLPQLDINWNQTYGGRDTSLEQTFNGIRRKQDDIMTFGVVGSFPIGNRTARGSYHRAKLEVSQEEQRLEAVKNNLMLNVRIAGRSVVTNKILIESSRLNRELQEVNVAAEEERLRLGTSTNQQVLNIQEDLTEAQAAEVQARVDAEKALVDLRVPGE
jgi:outer membrane protein TolC